MRERKLNKRELAYCSWRARDNSMEVSMVKAGYTCKGASARSWGSQLETRLNIQAQIQKNRLNIFDKKLITEEYVLESLKNLAETSVHESDRIRAIELLGKYLSMFTDKIETNFLDDKDKEEIRNRLPSLFEYFKNKC